MPVTGGRRSALCITDRLRGHATAGVRGTFYQNFFTTLGWDFDTLDVTEVGKIEVLAAAHNRDLIVLIKVASYDLVQAVRQKTHATLVFDFSDALWKPIHRRVGWHDLERILRCVDLVVCENDHLQPFARRHQIHSAGVITAPTAVPLERFDAARQPTMERADQSKSKFVIGWVGSRTTASALYKVRDSLVRLALRHPQLQVRLLGVTESAAAKILGEIPHSVVPEYDEGVMISEMMRFDVGLYPEPFDTEDYVARGPLKALLYMAAGLPVVCAPSGDCLRIIRDGESGMFASTTAEWERKLEALIQNDSLRRDMGRKALEAARLTQTTEVLYGALQQAIQDEANWKHSVRNLPPLTIRVRQKFRSLGFRADSLGARIVRMVKQRGRRLR